MNKDLFKNIDLEDMKIISDIKYDSRSRKRVEVKCKVCGLKREVSVSALSRNEGTKHGIACRNVIKDKSKEFKKFNLIYRNMVQRITNPNTDNFKYYGGRGIKDEFRDFIDFYFKMYTSFKEHYDIHGKDTELDRINNDGNYSSKNCRWVTRKINVNNRGASITQKKFKAISPEGKIFEYDNQHECGRLHDLDYRAINKCLRGHIFTHRNWKFKYIN